MSTKRKHQESELQNDTHPSRQSQVPGGNPKPAKKPRRFEPQVYKKRAHATSVNAIKKRIRDVTRRLERSEDLPANVRIEDERALATYQQELAEAEAEKMRQIMIKKYHMVRFFERRKAERMLKKLKKQLLTSKSTDEVQEIRTQMDVFEVDLNYTQYYPLIEPYVSLYPPKAATEEEEAATKLQPQSKPPLWTEVQKAMEEGEAGLKRMRFREPSRPASTSRPLERRTTNPKPKPQPATVDTTGMNRRERRSQRGFKEEAAKNKSKQIGNPQPEDAVDNDSDGGFFEI